MKVAFPLPAMPDIWIKRSCLLTALQRNVIKTLQLKEQKMRRCYCQNWNIGSQDMSHVHILYVNEQNCKTMHLVVN